MSCDVIAMIMEPMIVTQIIGLCLLQYPLVSIRMSIFCFLFVSPIVQVV